MAKNPNLFDFLGVAINPIKDLYKDVTGTKALEDANSQNYEMGLKQLELLEKSNTENAKIARANIKSQENIAIQNLGLQQAQFDYQKRLNQQQMQREDSAFQRQIADLEKAGLSPLMVASGASSSSLNSAPAPQIDTSGISAAQGSYLSLAQQYSALKQETMSDIRNTKANNARAIASNKQGAAFALANLVKGAAVDLNEAYWKTQNYRMQVEKQNKELQLIDEQLAGAKQEREWMSTHGYRNQDIMNVIIPIIENYLKGKDSDKVINDVKNYLKSIAENGIIKETKEQIESGISTIVEEAGEKAKEIKENVQNAIDNVPTIKIADSSSSPTSQQIQQAIDRYQAKQESKKSKQEQKQLNYVSEKMLTKAANDLNIKKRYPNIYYKIKNDRNGKPYLVFYDYNKIKPLSDKMYSPEAVRNEFERIKRIGN